MRHWTAYIPAMKEAALKGRVLQLGCGKNKYPGAVGIDSNPLSDADVLWDLNAFPYPFKENEFDAVICINALEHLNDIVKVMTEINRIAKARARVCISLAHFSDDGSYIDPTHVRHFSARSFDYFIEGTPLFDEYGFYSKARFALVRRQIGLHRLFRIFEPVVNRHIAFYEEVLCYMIRAEGIYIELEVRK